MLYEVITFSARPNPISMRTQGIPIDLYPPFVTAEHCHTAGGKKGVQKAGVDEVKGSATVINGDHHGLLPFMDIFIIYPTAEIEFHKVLTAPLQTKLIPLLRILQENPRLAST